MTPLHVDAAEAAMWPTARHWGATGSDRPVKASKTSHSEHITAER